MVVEYPLSVRFGENLLFFFPLVPFFFYDFVDPGPFVLPPDEGRVYLTSDLGGGGEPASFHPHFSSLPPLGQKILNSCKSPLLLSKGSFFCSRMNFNGFISLLCRFRSSPPLQGTSFLPTRGLLFPLDRAFFSSARLKRSLLTYEPKCGCFFF